VLLGIEGAAAFGAASLAFLRFTGGAWGALGMLAASLACWIVLPALGAIERLKRTDV
jgi:Cu-processing system permease protein